MQLQEEIVPVVKDASFVQLVISGADNAVGKFRKDVDQHFKQQIILRLITIVGKFQVRRSIFGTVSQQEQIYYQRR